MTGKIEILGDGSTSGVIKAENGLTFHFDSTAVLAYDVAGLAKGQLVTFEPGSGKCPKAVNICVERVHHGDEKRQEIFRLRYIGFEQRGNIRAYRFEQVTPGQQTKTFIVSTDMTLFTKHHVGIQEGPALCLHCLLAELNAASAAVRPLLPCSLTDRDMLAHLASRPVPRPRPRPRHLLGASARPLEVPATR